ncbi:MAG: patatin-like phospholipase family protein [Halieaceae bacterium]|nr:patatin-like phospholipase family protein [Halieaceae bacterium]
MNQDPPPPAAPTPTLIPVLAGGGARLPAYIGILAGLDDLGIHYSHIVGVSGGSIVAALRASGRSLEEIRQIALDTNFSDFLGQNLFSLLRSGGLSNGDRFERWMDEQMDGCCFEDLDTDLTVIATDVRSGTAEVFSRATTPKERVSLAVRYSMSVPLLFSFKTHGEKIMTDGSILSEEALRHDWSGDGTPVVIFKLRGSGGFASPKGAPLVPLRGYLAMLIHTFLTTIAHEFVSDEFWLSTVIIDVGDISPVAFALPPQDKERLYAMGLSQTLTHLPRKMRVLAI